MPRSGPSRLPEHRLVSHDAEARLRASLGQSLEDWLRVRFGRIGAVVDGVAFPETEDEVRDALAWARDIRAIAIPVGGATSVVGHLTPRAGERPSLAIVMTRLRRLLNLDPLSQLATFEAGVAGPDLEAQLRAKGFMLGHYPQSFDYATLGGWIATRSCGQQSARYGRIEAMFAGGRIETPTGALEIPPLPASAAGPDLREWVLGSEGRIGVVTRATVRIARLPERERFIGYFLPRWEGAKRRRERWRKAGSACRWCASPMPPRTLAALRLAGGGRAVAWLENISLRAAAAKTRFFSCSASPAPRRKSTRCERRRPGSCADIARFRPALCSGGNGARAGSRAPICATRSGRQAMPSTRWKRQSIGRACPPRCGQWKERDARRWPRSARNATPRPISRTFTRKARASYSTFVFRAGPDFDTAFARWRALKSAVSLAIVSEGGTISHQHGVGKDHAGYLAAEKGRRGMRALEAMIDHFDPDGALASGNLLAERAP